MYFLLFTVKAAHCFTNIRSKMFFKRATSFLDPGAANTHPKLEHD